MTRALLSLLLLTAAACGDDDGEARPDAGDDDDDDDDDAAPFDGGAVSGDPFDANARAASLAAAICAHREACEPALLAYRRTTRAECEIEAAAELGYDAIEELVGAGRAAFSEEAFDRCVSSYEDALSDCTAGPEPGACEGIFTGNRPEGVACGATAECRDGLWCDAAPGACGACRMRAAKGESCESSVCGPRLDCLLVGDGARCVPIDADLGDVCGDLEGGLCRGHLQCAGPESDPFHCVAPSPLGEACDPTGVASDCAISENVACKDGMCVELEVVGPPEPCGAAVPENLCDATSFCDRGGTNDGVCAPLAAEGEQCADFEPCEPGSYCALPNEDAIRGTCTARVASGGACETNAECEDGNLCISSLCAPVRYADCD